MGYSFIVCLLIVFSFEVGLASSCSDAFAKESGLVPAHPRIQGATYNVMLFGYEKQGGPGWYSPPHQLMYYPAQRLAHTHLQSFVNESELAIATDGFESAPPYVDFNKALLLSHEATDPEKKKLFLTMAAVAWADYLAQGQAWAFAEPNAASLMYFGNILAHVQNKKFLAKPILITPKWAPILDKTIAGMLEENLVSEEDTRLITYVADLDDGAKRVSEVYSRTTGPSDAEVRGEFLQILRPELVKLGETEMSHPDRNTVSVFGSVRRPTDSASYRRAMAIGRRLAQSGFVVDSGGGPGVSEAANRGAYSVSPHLSIAQRIVLPFEEKNNGYTSKMSYFRSFIPRLRALMSQREGFVFFSGGFGTLNELCDVLFLKSIGLLRGKPVVIAEPWFWNSFLKHARDAGAIPGFVWKEIHFVEAPEKIVQIIKNPRESATTSSR